MLLLLPIAFISGILTVFSPCVLPVLPIILASGIDGKIGRVRGVIVGLVITFTLATLLLATVVRTLGISVDAIRDFAVVLLVLFGITLAFPAIWNRVLAFVERYWRVQPVTNEGSGFGGGFITGVSLGVVWTPCIGPIVATVATLAAVSTFSLGMVGVAFAYALGAGIPLYFIARGGQRVTSKLTVFKTNNEQIRQVFGVIVLATALMIFVGIDRKLQAWTLDNLPESWTQIVTQFEDQFELDTNVLRSTQDELTSAEPGSTVVRNVRLSTDFTGAKVDQSDLLQGCFAGKDCIPSIENPVFESAQEANWLLDSDIVFAVNYQGERRAYPQRILNWHEIVNDELAGDPVSITFCPLCGSAVAFHRIVDGIITEFGVSGKLHNSDLVMYDRYEGNLWQQITGEAIVGPAARRDERLRQLPIITTTWGEWSAEYPDTLVLSRETGFARNYDAYPYGTYESDDQLLFGVEGLDQSLQIKTVVYGIEINGESKAYPESIFETQPRFEDELGGVPISLERSDAGAVTVTNQTTGEEIIAIRLFWFAWASFHPETELYQDQ
ncbi:MAG: DUF3179 domain-containing (seleno)protein [Patescibacteria group bacterium]